MLHTAFYVVLKLCELSTDNARFVKNDHNIYAMAQKLMPVTSSTASSKNTQTMFVTRNE